MLNGILLTAGETATEAFDLASTMSEAVTKVQGDLFGVLGIVVPAIVAVVGAIIGIKFGISWLSSLKSKH